MNRLVGGKKERSHVEVEEERRYNKRNKDEIQDNGGGRKRLGRIKGQERKGREKKRGKGYVQL